MITRKETLGEFMKRWRYTQGWSQKKTAEELNISTFYYNQLENSSKGRKFHSARLIKKMSDLTGATVSFLLGLPSKKEEHTENEDNEQ